MNHAYIREILYEAKIQGKMVQVHHRRTYRPDMDGLKRICEANKNICFIELKPNKSAGYCDEYYHACTDSEISKLGRQTIEQSLLNPERKI